VSLRLLVNKLVEELFIITRIILKSYGIIRILIEECSEISGNGNGI